MRENFRAMVEYGAYLLGVVKESFGRGSGKEENPAASEGDNYHRTSLTQLTLVNPDGTRGNIYYSNDLEIRRDRITRL